MRTSRRKLLAYPLAICMTVALGLQIAGCGGIDSRGSNGGHALTLGLAYIPDIQFAPFYMAQEKGYYKQAGLHVTLRHHAFSEDEFGALAGHREDALFGGGDEMMQAHANGIPVVDVATFYQKYPVALLVPAKSPIRSAADLRGKTVGTPGRFGETYFGLLAMLQSGKLKQSDVTIKFIQFTQVSALIGHKVDAAMGYLNNETTQLQQARFPARALALSDTVPNLPLVGSGFGALSETLKSRGDDIRKLVAATIKGAQATIRDPQAAVRVAEKYVPGLNNPKKAAYALTVLKATLLLWKGPGKMGGNNPATWQAMARYMYANGLIKKQVAAKECFSNAYLP